MSLTIEPGESVAILGQNGSGKTTLVKHLNGLLRPAEGRSPLGGADRESSIAELAATVGFVFQNPDEQLFERTVEREVAFGPRNLGVGRRRSPSASTDSLNAVGLTRGTLDRPV